GKVVVDQPQPVALADPPRHLQPGAKLHLAPEVETAVAVVEAVAELRRHLPALAHGNFEAEAAIPVIGRVRVDHDAEGGDEGDPFGEPPEAMRCEAHLQPTLADVIVVRDPEAAGARRDLVESPGGSGGAEEQDEEDKG